MSNKRRQELYDRIRQSSADEVTLEEMVRLGFWPKSQDLPEDPATEIRRRGELQREIRALRSEAERLRSIDAMKREARRRRMAAAREKRVETRKRREAERRARAVAWKERKSKRIDYLGPGVSTELGRAESDTAKLQAQGLPLLSDAASIAAAMGIEVSELRFLAYDRKVSSQHHYVRFLVPKKTGGDRLISAPMPRLKATQHWVLDNVLDKLPLHDAAHGFVSGRSICSNARVHLGSSVVVNMDMADFFPTLTWKRVRGMFRGLGYSPEAASLLALLCTEREVDEVELDGKVWFVATSERVLPQGSPASPAITNFICRGLDARLEGLARKQGFRYTRYADDLTFSSVDKGAPVGKLLGAVRRFVEDEGFTLRDDKTRVMRAGRKQEVTGLTVNEKLGVDRKTLRRFRAVLFQIERDGPAGKRWGQGGNVLASIVGFAAYVHMVDPEKGGPLLEQARVLASKHGWRGERKTYPSKTPSWVLKKQAAEAAVREAAEAARMPAAGPKLTEPKSAKVKGDAAKGDAAPKKKKKWWQFWK